MTETHTPFSLKLRRRTYRRRRIDQYVIMLPTNGRTLMQLAMDLNAEHPDIPENRVKITIDDHGNLIVSVPTDWAAEDDATAEPTCQGAGMTP